MSFITRILKQTCVYWELAGEDSAGEDFDDYGQPQFLAPVEISCRWSEESVEFVNSNDIKKMSRSKVYLNQDVREGEVLMLGELTDITEDINILENDGAWTIQGRKKIPNLRATEFLRIVFL